MKTAGYTLLAFASLFVFTPRKTIAEVKLQEPIYYTNVEDSDTIISKKIDTIETMKIEIIQLQKELGIRKQ